MQGKHFCLDETLFACYGRVQCRWLIVELTSSETTRGRLLGTPAKLTLADDFRSEPHEISLSVAIRILVELCFIAFVYIILDI